MSCQTLTQKEKLTLARLEKSIRASLGNVKRIGKDLAAIRDRKLYRQTDATFEDYCKRRWGFTAQTGRNYITVAEVEANLQNALGKNTPVSLSVRAANALKTVPAEVQRELVQQADDPEDADELKRLADEWGEAEKAEVLAEESAALDRARAPAPKKQGKDLVKRIEELVGRLEKLFAKVDQAEMAEELEPIKKRLGLLSSS